MDYTKATPEKIAAFMASKGWKTEIHCTNPEGDKSTKLTLSTWDGYEFDPDGQAYWALMLLSGCDTDKLHETELEFEKFAESNG